MPSQQSSSTVCMGRVYRLESLMDLIVEIDLILLEFFLWKPGGLDTIEYGKKGDRNKWQALHGEIGVTVR
jgi:hypothetical protein